MKGRTWKKISPDRFDELEELLLRLGATEDEEVRGQSELWRCRIDDGVFTMYETGTLYFSGARSREAEIAARGVNAFLGTNEADTEKEFLIGMDETGKGEVLGPSVLAAVVMRPALLETVEEILGAADTKKRHEFEFWDQLYKDLAGLKGRGVSFEIETIPPWDVDKYHVNKLMDIVYHRLLDRLLLGLEPSKSRIVLDDYGMGKNLDEYLRSLKAAGAEVRIEARADENYVEVRAAAILAKWRREVAMKKIGEKFSFPGIPIGSGNAGDPKTVRWLEAHKDTGEEWPWFVKTSWKTIRDLDGREDAPRKLAPPVRHGILSRDSQEDFHRGGLTVSSLSVICPDCGSTLKACKLTPEPSGRLVGRCISCNEVIEDLNTTLRYYCGKVLPDSSTIISGAMSKDLARRGFLGGYTLLLHPTVAMETDTPGGKRELERLGDYAAMDRIGWRKLTGPLESGPEPEDEKVIEAARLSDAILVTRDKGMYGNAVAQGLFVLTFKA